MTKGSIYIMKNPSFREENMLKIGQTKHSVEQRAKNLFTTGLPESFNVVYQQDVPDCVRAEKLIHKKLSRYRFSNRREFFVLPLNKAIKIVQEVIQEHFYATCQIDEGTYFVESSTTLRWNSNSEGLMLLVRQPNLLGNELSPIDLWWTKPKDHVLITNRIEDDPEKIVKYASRSKINGSLSEIMNFYPGDRVAILETKNSELGFRQMSLFGDDSLAISIIDFHECAKVIAFMENVMFHPDGFPIPFGMAQHSEISPEDTRVALNKILDMGIPKTHLVL